MNRTLGNRHGSAVIILPSDTEILITRQFDAPAALVFKAVTTVPPSPIRTTRPSTRCPSTRPTGSPP
jgi:hypothetical protein